MAADVAAHEWVQGAVKFFTRLGGWAYFKQCVRCRVEVQVTRAEWRELPLERITSGTSE